MSHRERARIWRALREAGEPIRIRNEGGEVLVVRMHTGPALRGSYIVLGRHPSYEAAWDHVCAIASGHASSRSSIST